MAGVHAQGGRLLVSFQYPRGGRRLRCREFLGLSATRDNRRLAARVAAEIERELALGTFDYAARFPASPNLYKLGIAAPAAPPASPTLATYAKEWLEARRPHLRPGTCYDYGLLIGRHIAERALGGLTLERLTRAEVEHWIAELQAAGVRPRRLNMALARLRSIVRTAEEDGLLARNPMRLVRSLREPRAEIDPFTEIERAALMEAARPGMEQAFVATLLYAGLRPSEALGLRWSDIDLVHGVICVRRGRGRFGVGLTKTSASEREVDIAPELMARLLSAAMAGLRQQCVFVMRDLRPLSWDNFRRRLWPRMLGEAGVRMRPPYQCRHTFATLMLSAGESPQYVAHQLGHASLAMLIRHYARWSSKPRSRAQAEPGREAGAGDGRIVANGPGVG